MKAQIQIAVLAVLTAMSPLALALANNEYKYNAEYKSIDKGDISAPDGAVLAQHIGKTMFIKGQLTRMPSGRVGIIPLGNLPEVFSIHVFLGTLTLIAWALRTTPMSSRPSD